MNLTEVRVKLVGEITDRLKAYCSITIDDCFVVRDLKVIDGSSGLFVAMPSRKLSCRCHACKCKNHLRARFCNECGAKLTGEGDPNCNRAKLHADIAHPINADCRQIIQTRVIEEFEAEVERAKDPNYTGGTYDDIEYDDEQASPYEELIRELKGGANSHRKETPQRQQQPERSEQPRPAQSTKAQPRPIQPPASSQPAREPQPAKREPTPQTSNEGFGAGIL